MNTKLNTKLRDWRNENGYTLEEVAGICGLSVSMLSLVERGKRKLRPATRILVARRLGVSVSELFEPDPLPEEVGVP